MLEAHHFTAAAKRKGSYALPEQFDGKVNQPVLHQTIRAQLNTGLEKQLRKLLFRSDIGIHACSGLS